MCITRTDTMLTNQTVCTKSGRLVIEAYGACGDGAERRVERSKEVEWGHLDSIVARSS